jgi:hypothetical protein
MKLRETFSLKIEDKQNKNNIFSDISFDETDSDTLTKFMSISSVFPIIQTGVSLYGNIGKFIAIKPSADMNISFGTGYILCRANKWSRLWTTFTALYTQCTAPTRAVIIIGI